MKLAALSDREECFFTMVKLQINHEEDAVKLDFLNDRNKSQILKLDYGLCDRITIYVVYSALILTYS